MKRTRNVFIIISIILMTAGIITASASLCMTGFDFSQFNSSMTGMEVKEMNREFKADYQRIIIDAKDREIKFEKSDDDRLHLEYTESEKRRFDINESGAELKIIEQFDYKWYDYIFNFDFGNKLVVKLPSDIKAQISVNTSNGKISFTDISIKNSVELHTSNGAINITDVSIDGNINAQTNNGRIELVSAVIAGKADMKTSNGECSADGASVNGEFKLKTSNGKIYLNNAKAEDISAETSNGKIEFYCADVDKSINAQTSNGKIEGTLVGIPGDFSFRYETSSYNKSNLPLEGNGGKQAYFKTSNGDIDVAYTGGASSAE
ncbi:MAG: DUF4097 family beta strand repeat-containing protein [Acutalibacteraceae bacterium]